jgi:hypothetical protein
LELVSRLRLCVFIRFGIRVYVFFILKLFMGLNKAKSATLGNPRRPHPFRVPSVGLLLLLSVYFV